MSKHTPGPWAVDSSDFGIYQIETNAQIAEVFSHHPDAEMEANARLIAASPILLDALKLFAEHFGPLEDNIMLHPAARRCFALARSVIAEVEGES